MGDDMNKTTGNQVLLTSDDIARWQADVRQAEAAKAKAEEIIADRTKKLEAAALLSGVGFSTMTPENDAIDEEESMPVAAERILATLPRLVTHAELRAELRKIPRFREILDKHKGAYYYTLVGRLVEAEKIKKVGKKIRLIHKNEEPTEGNPEGSP
jgi:hypothetical protein